MKSFILIAIGIILGSFSGAIFRGTQNHISIFSKEMNSVYKFSEVLLWMLGGLVFVGIISLLSKD